MKFFSATLAIAVIASTVVPHSAFADFYAGKTLTVVVNYPAGGPTDIEARLVAKFIGEHIPGKPTVIVKNMGGGGGNIAANYLGEVVPDDATQMGYFTWNPVDQITEDPGLRVKYSDFRIVAGFKQPVVTYVRTDVPPGIKVPADIAKTSEVIAAALAPNNHLTLRQSWALDLLGVNHKTVAGYKGLKAVQTAVLQDEAQLASTSISSYRGSIEPTMIEPGIAIPLFHFDVRDEDGNFGPAPSAKGIPSFLELFHSIKGADQMPEGVTWEAATLVGNIMDNVYRTVLLPPDVPEDALSELRQGFVELMKDEEFIEAYRKLANMPPEMSEGEGAELVVRKLDAVDPEVAAFIKNYSAGQ